MSQSVAYSVGALFRRWMGMRGKSWSSARWSGTDRKTEKFVRYLARSSRRSSVNSSDTYFANCACLSARSHTSQNKTSPFAMLQRVVVELAVVLDRDVLAQVGQLDDDLRVVVVNLDGRDVLDDRLDLTQDVRDEDGVVGRQVASRLLDDGRVRDVLVVADLHDGVDDVVGELLRRVVGRRVERRLRAVVIDGHPAADVQEVYRHLHLDDLGVDARGLLHRVLAALDVRELRADVEVQELEHVHPACLLHPPDDFENLRGGEPELRRLAARLLPAPRALRVEFDAQADHRQVALLEAVG